MKGQKSIGAAKAHDICPSTSRKMAKVEEKSFDFGVKERLRWEQIHFVGITLPPAFDYDANISRELPLPGDISHFMV
jgi:hypothetical protein